MIHSNCTLRCPRVCCERLVPTETTELSRSSPNVPGGALVNTVRHNHPSPNPPSLMRVVKTPRVGQESSKPAQELPRASQDDHKAFPKHLARQPFSENSKNSNYGCKRHSRRLRSLISMNPKGLAANRRMKKGERAAVPPQRGRQSAARTVRRGSNGV